MPAGRLEEVLGPLPVEALRLPAGTIGLLRELGIATVAQLEHLPRADLPARFGTEALRRLDEALGRRPESISPMHPPEQIEAHWRFEAPFSDRQTLESVLEHLTAE